MAEALDYPNNDAIAFTVTIFYISSISYIVKCIYACLQVFD
jgi:hypothetical protein